MNKMFEEDRVVFTEEENAREGAFTTLVGMEPFCFFGPGYHNVSTVIHELGHFYGAVEGDMMETPLDLAETQSQGNEWLFAAFLQDQLPEGTYRAYLSYKLYEVIAETLVQLAVDAFEKAVYSHPNVENLTQADFELIMAEVAQAYGGIQFFNKNITDLQSYWKMVVVESPVYYISYAVSSMAALNIYTLATENREEATNVYCRLAENDDYDDGFLAIITDAGLPGPFQEDVYEDTFDALDSMEVDYSEMLDEE
jgi:oligoendopeptidase F